MHLEFRSPWLSKLDSFRTLKDGWNGYSAPAPSPLAIDFAAHFLSLCQEHNLTPTRCAPSAVGGVGVTFRHDQRKGYVEFYNDGRVALLLADDATRELHTMQVEPTDENFRATIGEVRAFVDGRHP
jgi:hypothetical protein